MLNNKKVYAVIPVRGGSKGIPKKNLYKIGDLTLLERAILLGKKCEYVDKVFVSTDDQEMYDISKKYEANTPRLRPSYLATDSARTIDVVINLMDELLIEDSYILLLQAIAPLRRLDDLENLFKLFELNINKCSAIVSLTEFDDPHPNKIQKIECGFVKSYLGVESMVPRQELPKVYKLNGAFYMTSSDILRSQHTFIPEKTIPYIMPKERSLNLDNIFDLYLLESLIKNNRVEIDI